MAISDRLTDLWPRWFGSRPHLVGAAVALLLVGAALLGVLETLLRPHFGFWWVVVLAGYLVGWLLTSVVMWRFRRGAGARSWVSTVLPPRVSPAVVAKAPVARERKGRFTVGMVAVVAGAAFLLLMLLGSDKAEAVGTIMSAMAALVGILLVHSSAARPDPGDQPAARPGRTLRPRRGGRTRP